MKPILFAILLLYISAISLYDGLLVVRTGEEISEYERNPVACCLLQANGGRAEILLRAKAAGTLVVCAALVWMRRKWRWAADVCCGALAAFQTGLVIYLQM